MTLFDYGPLFLQEEGGFGATIGGFWLAMSLRDWSYCFSFLWECLCFFLVTEGIDSGCKEEAKDDCTISEVSYLLLSLTLSFLWCLLCFLGFLAFSFGLFSLSWNVKTGTDNPFSWFFTKW